MPMHRRIEFLLFLALAGCASPPARVATAPAAPREAAPPAPAPETPEPVYRNPKIGVVYLRAHEDAQGRLLGPQVMYQVVEPGGWNIDAAEEGRGFIPVSNAAMPAVQSAGRPCVGPENSPLLDPEFAGKTTILDLMRLEDRNEAEAVARRAGDGRIAVFDDQAGWLLVPAGGEGGRPDGRAP